MRFAPGLIVATLLLTGGSPARAETPPVTITAELSIGTQTFSYGFLGERVVAPTARLDLVALRGSNYGVLTIERLIERPHFERSAIRGTFERRDMDLSFGHVFDPSGISRLLDNFRLYAFAGYKLGETEARYIDGFEIRLRESGPFVGGALALFLNDYDSAVSASLSYGHFLNSRYETERRYPVDINYGGTVEGGSAVVKFVQTINSTTKVALAARYLSYDLDADPPRDVGKVQERSVAVFLSGRVLLR